MEAKIEELISVVERHNDRIQELEDTVRALTMKALGKQTDAALFDELDNRISRDILKCVMCGCDYYNAMNGQGHCDFHPGPLSQSGWDLVYSCCGKKARNVEEARRIPGCTKGKHYSHHHEEFPYASYVLWTWDQEKVVKDDYLTVDPIEPSNGSEVFASIGVRSDGKIRVKLGYQRRAKKYLIFSKEELSKMTQKDEVKVVSSAEGGDGEFYSSFKWIVDEKDAVNGIELSVKVSTEKIPLTKRLELKNITEPGEITVISDPEASKEKKVYEVPEFDNSKNPILIDIAKVETTVHTCCGEAAEKCKVKAHEGHYQLNMDQYARDGKFNNYFLNNFQVANLSEKKFSLNEITAEISRDNCSTWEKVPKVFVGARYEDNWGHGNFRFDASTLPLKIKEQEAENIAVSVPVVIEGETPNFSMIRRVHPSLGEPFHIRYHFALLSGETTTLEVEYSSPALNFVDPTTYCTKDWRIAEKNLLYTLVCDDVEKKERCFWAVYYKDDMKMLTVRPYKGNQYFMLGKKALVKHIDDACKQNKSEFPMKEGINTEAKNKLSYYLLVDTAARVAYGIKMVIETHTGRAEGSFLLPLDEMAE